MGIGFGIQYTPAATREEIWRMYQVGAEHGVTGFAHVRFASMAEPGSSVEAVQEMIAIAATGGVRACLLPNPGTHPRSLDSGRPQSLQGSTAGTRCPATSTPESMLERLKLRNTDTATDVPAGRCIGGSTNVTGVATRVSAGEPTIAIEAGFKSVAMPVETFPGREMANCRETAISATMGHTPVLFSSR